MKHTLEVGPFTDSEYTRLREAGNLLGGVDAASVVTWYVRRCLRAGLPLPETQHECSQERAGFALGRRA